MASSTSATVSVVVVGTIVTYLSAPIFSRALRYISEFLFGRELRKDLGNEGILVFVKTQDKIVPVQLSPKWSISQVKHHLAKFLGNEAEELRIIVAGHELRNDVKVEECDLGESTVINAVKVTHRPISLPSPKTIEAQQEAFTKDLNETALNSTRNANYDTKSNAVIDASKHSSKASVFEGDQPMNACLLDLQLTEDERILRESEKLQTSHNNVPLSAKLNDVDSLLNYPENTSEEPKIVSLDVDEKTKAHFWVYCSDSSCGRTIQPGKLRVRCETCNEGAIIVTSDPCSWEDVLNSGRIQGYCQNINCPDVDGSNTERKGEGARIRPVKFYFKCNGLSHNPKNKAYTSSRTSNDCVGGFNEISSTEAPPLYLIRSNLKDIPCLGKLLLIFVSTHMVNEILYISMIQVTKILLFSL